MRRDGRVEQSIQMCVHIPAYCVQIPIVCRYVFVLVGLHSKYIESSGVCQLLSVPINSKYRVCAVISDAAYTAISLQWCPQPCPHVPITF